MSFSMPLQLSWLFVVVIFVSDAAVIVGVVFAVVVDTVVVAVC